MSNSNRKKVGLVLGGGGARGLAHIGVLKVLRRENVPIDYIVGTSMGGIIGAALAANVPLEVIEEEALHIHKLSKQIKLVDLQIGGSALLKGTRVYRFIGELIGKDLTFDKLDIPFAVVAVDIKTGREVILNKGNVSSAIRATISVPGVFEPVEYENFRLVDGGVLNNVPVDVAKKMGADYVIAIDVLPSFPQNTPGETPVVRPIKLLPGPQSMYETLNIMLIMISEMTELRLKCTQPDLVIRPDLPHEMGLLLGFEYAETAIQAGEKAAQERLSEICRLAEACQ
jgi:NTE family protein